MIGNGDPLDKSNIHNKNNKDAEKKMKSRPQNSKIKTTDEDCNHHPYCNTIITASPRGGTVMSHARIPVVLDEDIRRNYIKKNSHNNNNSNRQGGKRRAVVCNNSSGSNSSSGSCNEHIKNDRGSSYSSGSSTWNTRTRPPPPVSVVVQELPTRRIVSPEGSVGSVKPYLFPLNGLSVKEKEEEQTTMTTRRRKTHQTLRSQRTKTTSRSKLASSAVTPTASIAIAVEVDPHLQEHHLWDEYGFERFRDSLDDNSTVGTSLSRKCLLKKHDIFVDSSFVMKEECHNESDTFHRSKVFSISKLMPKHNSRKKKEKKNGNREDPDEDLLSQRGDYAIGVQNYGEKDRKYDAMCMVGKYRLAYESMFLDEITGDLMNHSSYNMTTNCDMSGVGSGVECERERERLLDSTNRSNKQSVDQGRMDKSGALDRFNSHDEMSPLVIRSKATLFDTVRSTSHDEMSPWVPKKVAAAKNNDSINTKTTTGTTDTDGSTRVVESKESKSKHDSIQASKVPTLYEDKESIHNMTPKKANTRTKRSGGPFLDKSWQPSPIQPEGSFAIFNDSQAVTLHEYESLAITSSKCGHESTAITTFKGVQTSPESIKTNEQVSSNEDFLKIVAAIVIQTFFRRHLAYKLAWNRYSAVLTIQRFLGRILQRKKYREAVMKRTTFHFYDLAATQIQAAWRGWWVRDCLNVETYCACMIQKAFRCHLAQRQYVYDLQRIIVVQSVMRRFLTTLAIEKQTKAATTIQTVWRKSAAKHKYINTLVDILIVQSVCRRFLALKRIASINKKKTMPQRQTPKRVGGIISSKHYHPRRPRGREVDVEVNQLNANELILKWESRQR